VKLSTYVIGVPAAVIAAVVAVANRQDVTFSLDPFSQTTPAIAVQVPLFLLLFAALILGVLLGGFASFIGRTFRRVPKPPVEKESSASPGSSVTKLLPWNRGKSKSGGK